MTAYVIEDEPSAAARLIKMIRETTPDIEIIGQMETVEDAIAALSRAPQPDVVFLDIHLADGESFEIFEHVNVRSKIIFTTAFDQYALKAFRVHALDYLLKPIKHEELKEALAQLRRMDARGPETLQQLTEDMMRDKEQVHKRFLIRLGQNIKLLSHDDIAWCYISDKVTFLVNHEGKRYPTDHTLEQLEILLPALDFFRINRQYIVNMKAIKSMRPASKSRIEMTLEPPADSSVYSSTERSSDFKKWLKGEEST